MIKYLKKILTIISIVAMSLCNIHTVFAAGSTVYVSPSSQSVTTGGNVTVSVRVSAGSGSVDSVQATLNYDSSRLQYVSYSAGAFTTFSAANSGSSFSYVGMLLGSSVSGDNAMFSVTFKSLSAGSASLSVGGADIAYQGSSLAPVGVSGGSVSINDPVVVTPPPTTPTTPTAPSTPTNNTPTTTTQTEEDTSDKTAPVLSGDLVTDIAKNTIGLVFKTNEPASINITYGSLSQKNDQKTTDHSFTLGNETKLTAGTAYLVEITATDESGNSAVIYKQELKTKGIDYTVRITDKNGNPLVNHEVQLFSDPKTATTDNDGYVTFSDVPPGEHTLVFDLDGLTMRRTVAVTDSDTSSDVNQSQASPIELPVYFAADVLAKPAEQTNNYVVVAVSVAIGVALAYLLKRKNFVWLKSKILSFRPKKPEPPQGPYNPF